MIEGFVGLRAILHEHGWLDDVANAFAAQIINDPALNTPPGSTGTG